MTIPDHDLLRRTEALILKVQNFAHSSDVSNVLPCLKALALAILNDVDVFGIEPWHPVCQKPPLSMPGEMLLRLKNVNGQAIPPYPAIMFFYSNDMTPDIDSVLALCALRQFQRSKEQQVSINVSARSLRDADFIKTIAPAIELMNLSDERKIIFEIHESAADQIVSKHVLDLFRQLDVSFAIDDVGLSMNDVFRLSEFEGIADFVKLDRKSVCVQLEKSNSLDRLITLVKSTLPEATLVAEGVKSAEHAAELLKFYPDIDYVQGLYLPEREQFAKEWKDIRSKMAA